MKGYSLVELLAVIVVLGIIATIAYPVTRRLVNKNIDQTYKEQIDYIEQISHTWLSKNLNKVGYEEPYYLQFSQLIDDGLLKTKEVLNPKTKQPLAGCIEITWNTDFNQHIIKYMESCPE